MSTVKVSDDEFESKVLQARSWWTIGRNGAGRANPLPRRWMKFPLI